MSRRVYRLRALIYSEFLEYLLHVPFCTAGVCLNKYLYAFVRQALDIGRGHGDTFLTGFNFRRNSDYHSILLNNEVNQSYILKTES